MNGHRQRAREAPRDALCAAYLTSRFHLLTEISWRNQTACRLLERQLNENEDAKYYATAIHDTQLIC